MDNATVIKSEYGKGFTYCLGLFLGHEMGLYRFLETERLLKEKNPRYQPVSPYSLWFNGAADHLFDLDTENAPEELRERARIFKDKCLKWRVGLNKKDQPTREDFDWATREAKDMLMAVDEKMGIKTEQGEWE